MSEIAAERFVRAFHARRPGVTRAAFARGRAVGDGAGRSSYELLAAEVPAGGRVLDLGAGDGVVCAGAIALDLSGEELARRAGPRVQARAEAIPFARGAFDACVSHLAFSILPDPAAAAREVARVVRPGGVFAIVTGGAPADGDDDAFAWILAHAGATPRLGDKRCRWREGLDELLGPAGFAPCTWRSHTIDLGGEPTDVWDTIASIYELAALDEDRRASLREDFVGRAGRVRCAIRIGVAAARRAPVG
jgi:SAM-dependent methyltransferase